MRTSLETREEDTISMVGNVVGEEAIVMVAEAIKEEVLEEEGGGEEAAGITILISNISSHSNNSLQMVQ